MISRLFRLLFTCVFLAAGFLPAVTAAQDEVAGSRKIDYRVTWNAIPAGSFSLEFAKSSNPGKEEFMVRGETKVGGLLGRISPFEAEAASFFCSERLVPFRSFYHARERERTTLEKTEYSHEKGTGSWTRQRSTADGEIQHRNEEFEIPVFFQDPLSLMQYLRSIDLEVGKDIEVPVIVDRKEYQARVRVRERRAIRVMGRVRMAYILVSDVGLVDAGRREGSLWIWISDDDERLPLRFSSRVPLGLLTMSMTDYRDF